MATQTSQSIKLFYCYAREDHNLREKLAEHLTTLHRIGLITGWYDGEIIPGASWKEEVEIHINTADIILLLISSAFIQSDYCYSKEMERALERHCAKEARVVPILLRPVDWGGTPFSTLQMLPSHALPVTSWPNPDEAFEDVAKGIRRVVDDLLIQRHSRDAQHYHIPLKETDTIEATAPSTQRISNRTSFSPFPQHLSRRKLLVVGGCVAVVVLSSSFLVSRLTTVPTIQAKSITTMVGGTNTVSNCQYLADQDRLFFVEWGTGKLSFLDRVSSNNPTYQVVGTGYTNPSGIAVTADGNHAYVGLTTGELLSVDLKVPNAQQAKVIVPGNNFPVQLMLDEPSKTLYVLESGPASNEPLGVFYKLQLQTGTRIQLLENLARPLGFLLSSDKQAVYITEQYALTHLAGIVRYNLVSKEREVLVMNTIQNRAFWALTWANSNMSAFIVPERSPGTDTSSIWYLDITQNPTKLQLVAVIPDDYPLCSARIKSDSLFPLIVGCGDKIVKLDL